MRQPQLALLTSQHAFDDTGRLYDKTGRLTNWWTNATAARFDELRQCVIDQYADYYVTGPDGKRWHVNVRRAVDRAR